MDFASFFRDMSTGGDSALSNVVLATVDALSKVTDIVQFQKQVVFLVVTGEAWGYLGSRRFLAELAARDQSVAGLSASRIYQMSAATPEIFQALQLSASSLTAGKDIDNVEVKLADKENPGIPLRPSCLFTNVLCFAIQNDTTAGVVVEEFDGAFKSPFDHSHFDGADNINISAVVCTASLIARSVYILGNSAANLTSLYSIVVNTSIVNELVDCLLSHTPPGMNCDLVRGLITPTEEFANHYVGVILGSPSATPYAEYIDDTARFAWNFLASRTGVVRDHQTKDNGNGPGNETTAVSPIEECTQACSRENEVCVASTGQHKGYCVLSTTRYVPAYSPRLQYEAEGWRLIAATPGDIMSEVDLVWTESFWKSISLRLYGEESSRHNKFMLLLGFAVTVGSFPAIIVTEAVVWKHLKRD